MKRETNGRTGASKVRSISLLSAIGLLLLTAGSSYAEGAAQVLKAYDGLTGKEREAKLI